MKLYKLTDAKYQTRGKMQWGAGVTHRANCRRSAELCTSSVLHAYTSPLLAAFMCVGHVSKEVRKLWVAEGKVAVTDGTKVGCRVLTTVKRTGLPKVTTEQRVKFAILCAMQVYVDAKFAEWANNWLSGKDRSASAACAAYAAAAATKAADAADAAAAAAAYAARAARAADAAAAAADAAARAAAYAAASARKTIDFDAIAKQAMS